jgi:nucleoside-diphosphate-sugar epimerase
MSDNSRVVLVTGGAGYVGAVLVPRLLAAGHEVRVLDLYLYGKDVLDAVKDHPRLQQIQGDVRDQALLTQALRGCDSVIHLACISNDPSFELNPALGRSINYDAFGPLVDLSRAAGVRRFIYASSSSVYGLKDEREVTEDLLLEPLTDYSRYKALCEEILLNARARGFEVLILRPATVCGYSPRQRLDVIVNIFTTQAITRGQVAVWGGAQNRPNIHIEEMADLYLLCLEAPAEQVDGQTFNAGGTNHTIAEIAQLVRDEIGEQVRIATTHSDDVRSYRISSRRLADRLGFVARRGVAEAVRDLKSAFVDGRIREPLTNSRYYNIRTMQEAKLR